MKLWKIGAGAALLWYFWPRIKPAPAPAESVAQGPANDVTSWDQGGSQLVTPQPGQLPWTPPAPPAPRMLPAPVAQAPVSQPGPATGTTNIIDRSGQRITADEARRRYGASL